MLRSTPVSVSEDFCKATRHVQKKLLNFAKSTGQPYYLKYNKINKKAYVYCPVTDRVTEAGPIYDNPVHVAPEVLRFLGKLASVLFSYPAPNFHCTLRNDTRQIIIQCIYAKGACLRDSERLTVLAWQDLGRGLLLSGNPHLRARFQIVHRRRDERRKVLAWRGRALSGYRLPSDGSFTRPLTPAAATSFPHRTSTRRRLRHHRDSTSPQPPGPQAPPRETID
ncbi:hypothetical protein HPB51_025010 [Rhipicephalus microplus]|uniref:Uncharacterized protein n=1 Tax=Rhipicephalus microplus TaxID=6941 RepID=A0A9J6E4M9_RHIMP|nr:hypothetical protein HPB51_025010 [Rhipicephalus microplus]